MQNRVNEELTPALLRKLAEAKPPCITVAIQTGGNVHARLEDAVRQVEAELQATHPDVPEHVFAPLRESLGKLDVPATGSLVILSSPDFHLRFQTQAPVKETVVADDDFQLRALLPLLNEKADFYMLALSQHHLRLLHCTEGESGEVALPPDVPGTFNQSRQTRIPDHDLEGRSSGGPGTGSMKGVLFGTSSDDDKKDEFLANYYREIDRGVNHVLRDSKAPLVVVAVEHELALYRRINTYPDVVEPGVHGAPDGLKGGEMHKRALELVRSYHSERVRHALSSFEKMAGTGHASSHAHDIVEAAYEGRVSQLFLQETAEYRGAYDPMRRKVKRHEDGVTPMRDLVNECVVQTLLHGGEAMVLPASEMPNGLGFCAILRYPAPELQAAMKTNASGSATPV